jgi:hypothetical protein
VSTKREIKAQERHAHYTWVDEWVKVESRQVRMVANVDVLGIMVRQDAVKVESR